MILSVKNHPLISGFSTLTILICKECYNYEYSSLQFTKDVWHVEIRALEIRNSPIPHLGCVIRGAHLVDQFSIIR